jgi:hypothetical protein
MKTNDLIHRLGSTLAPVAPLPAPGRRALLWISGSALYLLLLVVVLAQLVPVTLELNAGFIGTQLLGVLAAALAAWAAFVAVIPGRSRHVLAVALLAGVAWLASFFVLVAARDAVGVAAAQEEWICVAMILLGGAPLVASLAVMLRKGAPMRPLQSGLLVGIAVGLFTNFAACLSSPHSDMSLAFLWHVGTIGALIIVCTLVCRAVLTWRRGL